ncbi:MAG TPA: hypothetical protein VEA44_11150 [Caulobacter sp.]|nr:hypothetical protein [Caulobacter sp.]
MRSLLIAVAVLAAPCAVLAQPDAPPAVPEVDAPASAAAAPSVTVAKNTLVTIALAEPLGSNTSKAGDRFAITLAEPLVVDGQVVLPAGTRGVGEVVHAAPSGLGGRSGELLLAARYLEVGETRIPLKAFQFAAVGRDTTAGSLWAMGLVKGGQIIVPAGARGTAKIAVDFTPIAPAARP